MLSNFLIVKKKSEILNFFYYNGITILKGIFFNFFKFYWEKERERERERENKIIIAAINASYAQQFWKYIFNVQFLVQQFKIKNKKKWVFDQW